MAFTLSQNQYNAMLARITALENQSNDIAIAIDKFVTNAQVNGVRVLLETDIASLQDEVDAIISRVDILENDPLS